MTVIKSLYIRYTAELKMVASFLGWALVFTILYSPEVFYNSNQNQYFLHGFAHAGEGFLREDWFVSTTNIKPAFSYFITLTQQIFGGKLIYYGYYLLALGVYLVALMGIVKNLFPKFADRRLRWLYLLIFFGLHSAALRFGMSVLGLSESWRYLFDGGVASQKLLGPVFQPASFGVLVLWAILLFLQDRPYWAAILTAFAAVMDPSIVHVSGVVVLAFVLILFWQREWLKGFGVGISALLVVLPLVIYLYLFVVTPTTPEVVALAQRMLVEFRNPHHAIPSVWFDASVVVKLGMVFGAIWVTRRTKLFLILLVPTVIALGLTAVQIILDNYLLALLYPWRISIIVVPLATAIGLAFGLDYFASRWGEWYRAHFQKFKIVGILMLIGMLIAGAVKFQLTYQTRYASDEYVLFEHVAETKQSGQVYMTPLDMQDFRLATGAPAFVDFKSVPTTDVDVSAWLDRVFQVIAFRDRDATDDVCYQLGRLAKEFGVTHVVQPIDWGTIDCERSEKVYRNPTYEIYTIQPPPKK